MPLTPDTINAAGQDAGNEHMRAAGRTKWNRSDYNFAVSAVAHLWDAYEKQMGFQS